MSFHSHLAKLFVFSIVLFFNPGNAKSHREQAGGVVTAIRRSHSQVTIDQRLRTFCAR
jgi:predicted phosphodiesterase